jgi:hypothetical protein
MSDTGQLARIEVVWSSNLGEGTSRRGRVEEEESKRRSRRGGVEEEESRGE